MGAGLHVTPKNRDGVSRGSSFRISLLHGHRVDRLFKHLVSVESELGGTPQNKSDRFSKPQPRCATQ
jgi:hypothetical protein